MGKDAPTATLDSFSGIDAYTLGDAARRHGVGGVFHSLKPQTDTPKFVGRALTARIEFQPNGNIPLSQYGATAFLDQVSPGDVLFLDGGGHFLSTLGDLAFGITQRRGGMAIVVNAAVRDIEDADPNFPIFALGVAIASIAGRGFVTGIGEPIFIDGQRVETGDVVAGCRGGIVTFPWAERDGVMQYAQAMIETDRLVREGIARGAKISDLWVQHKKPTE